MKREGDGALVADLLRRKDTGEFITFEDHYDFWVTCKGCRKTYHTSLFVSDLDKWKATGVFPEYLSDNGRSLLTKRICSPCLAERADRITRLIEKPRCMTPEAAAVVVDAAMFGLGCTEGDMRVKIQAEKERREKNEHTS